MKLTDEEIEKMKHCIGFDQKKTYMRNGIRYFKPYRNYYDAAEVDFLVWEGLCERGLADRNEVWHYDKKFCDRYYWLTIAGLAELSDALNIYIYSENASGNEIDASYDVLDVLKKDPSPLSSDEVAERARLPRRFTLDTLRYLRDRYNYTKYQKNINGDLSGQGWQLSDNYYKNPVNGF